MMVRTLDGKNTFHATQMAAWQRGPAKGNILDGIEPAKSATLQVPESLDKIFDVNFAHGSAKPKLGNVSQQWFEVGEKSALHPSEVVYTAFLYSRQDAELKSSWTSFNRAHSEINPPRTATGYMPIIQAPAHGLSTLNTAVLRAIHVAKALDNRYIVMTVDQALFPLLMELKWSVSEFEDALIPRLGGLHISMNFLRTVDCSKYGKKVN
jgi:hypothetical protein